MVFSQELLLEILKILDFEFELGLVDVSRDPQLLADVPKIVAILRMELLSKILRVAAFLFIQLGHDPRQNLEHPGSLEILSKSLLLFVRLGTWLLEFKIWSTYH